MHWNKKRFFTALAATATVVGFSLAGTLGWQHLKAAQAATNDKKTLVVATPGDMYASSFHDKKGHLTGYEVEIARQVAKGLGMKVEFKELNVAGELTAVASGKADLAAGNFNLSSVYAKRYLFSTPYKYSFGGLLVRAKDQSGIHSWSDLKGKKSAGEAGTSNQRFAQFMGAKLVNYDSANGLMNDVANGKTDFIPNDYYGLSTGMKRSKIQGLTMAKGLYYRTNLMGKGIGFLINKHEPGLQKKINKELAKLQKDGTLSKIMIKYYGHDLTKKPADKDVKYFKVPASVKGE